jgi:hypothetical protein
MAATRRPGGQESWSATKCAGRTSALHGDEEKNQQIQPKPIHEMPVEGGHAYGSFLFRVLFPPPKEKGNERKQTDPAEDVEAVRPRDHVDEKAAGVRSEEKTASNEFPPRDQLARDKRKAQ